MNTGFKRIVKKISFLSFFVLLSFALVGCSLGGKNKKSDMLWDYMVENGEINEKEDLETYSIYEFFDNYSLVLKFNEDREVKLFFSGLPDENKQKILLLITFDFNKQNNPTVSGEYIVLDKVLVTTLFDPNAMIKDKNKIVFSNDVEFTKIDNTEENIPGFITNSKLRVEKGTEILYDFYYNHLELSENKES